MMVFIYSLVVDALYDRGIHTFRDPEKQSDLLKNVTVTQDSSLCDCLSVRFHGKAESFPSILILAFSLLHFKRISVQNRLLW